MRKAIQSEAYVKTINLSFVLTVLWFGAGMGCGLAGEALACGVWSRTLLIIGGVCLGVFCYHFTALNELVKAHRAQAVAAAHGLDHEVKK